MDAQSRGELYDIGYRRYEGPREGRNRARIALWTNGMRTALGLGRGAPAKILPILLFAAITASAVVIVIIASFAEGFGASDGAGVLDMPTTTTSFRYSPCCSRRSSRRSSCAPTGAAKCFSYIW